MIIRLRWLAALCLVACGSSASGPDQSLGLTLRLDRATLVPGEQTRYTMTVTRGGVPQEAASVLVQSDNPDVATVAGSVITALKAGRVNITASFETAYSAAALEVLEGGVISPAGGTVRLTSGRVELVVPAGAVATPVAVTIVATTPPTVDPTAVRNATFAISPEVSLAAPATLRVTYNAANVPVGLPQGALGLRRANGVQWVDLSSTVDSTTSTVSAIVTQTGTLGVGRLRPAVACSGPEHRHFDFWLGDWNMTDTPSGQSAGTSTISMEPGGCAIFEEYVSPTPISPGRSISFYEPNTRRWYQQYIDAGNNRAELGSTSFSPTAITMRTADATVYKVVTWSRIDANTVTQVSNVTLNGGQTFTPEYNLTYRRRPVLQQVTPAVVSLEAFRRFAWITGRWKGIGTGSLARFGVFFEEYVARDDSTIIMRTYHDSTYTVAVDSSTFQWRAGRMSNVPARGNPGHVLRISGDTISWSGSGATYIRTGGDSWRAVFVPRAAGEAAPYYDMRRVR